MGGERRHRRVDLAQALAVMERMGRPVQHADHGVALGKARVLRLHHLAHRPAGQRLVELEGRRVGAQLRHARAHVGIERKKTRADQYLAVRRRRQRWRFPGESNPRSRRPTDACTARSEGRRSWVVPFDKVAAPITLQVEQGREIAVIDARAVPRPRPRAWHGRPRPGPPPSASAGRSRHRPRTACRRAAGRARWQVAAASRAWPPCPGSAVRPCPRACGRHASTMLAASRSKPSAWRTSAVK